MQERLKAVEVLVAELWKARETEYTPWLDSAIGGLRCAADNLKEHLSQAAAKKNGKAPKEGN